MTVPLVAYLGLHEPKVIEDAEAQPQAQVNALFVGHSLINYQRYIYDQTFVFGAEDAINGHDVVCSNCALLDPTIGPPNPPHASNVTTQDYMRYFLDIDARSGGGAAAYMYDPSEQGPPDNSPPVIPDSFDYVVAVDQVNNYWNVSSTNGLVDSFEWIYDFAKSHDPSINLVLMLPWGFEPDTNNATFSANTYFALEDLAALGKYFHVTPVGEVIRRVRADNVYNIDYLEDAIHPNANGEYIRMATFYATLTGNHPSALSVGDSTLTAPQKQFVDDTVWTVVHQCSFSLVSGPNSSAGTGECNASLPTPTPGGPTSTPTASATPTATPSPSPIPNTAAAVCASNGGEWLAEHEECLGLASNICTDYNGIYNNCASACRHNPDADFCTLNCVQICDFSSFQDNNFDLSVATAKGLLLADIAIAAVEAH